LFVYGVLVKTKDINTINPDQLEAVRQIAENYTPQKEYNFLPYPQYQHSTCSKDDPHLFMRLPKDPARLLNLQQVREQKLINALQEAESNDH